MQRIFLLFSFCLFSASGVLAQEDLFGNLHPKPKVHSGFVVGVNGDFDIPGADMGKRFGISYRVGPSVLYKTKSNWMIGAKFDFVLGGKIRQDSLMINIRSADGSFIDNTGIRKNVGIFERGYLAGVQLGRIVSLTGTKSDNGLLIMTGVGFMQHKISIVDKDGSINQIKGDYKKGYDRLTNGTYIEQFIGYSHFADNAIINYHIGFDIAAGFTKGRRDYLYDVMRTDNANRIDLLFGIRAGWYIPIFHRKSEEIFF